MPTQRQIVTLVQGRGFEQIDEPGFVSFIREHPKDGRKQWLRIFSWGNAKYADDEQGRPRIPRAYLVVIPGLDHDIDHGHGTRFRLPLVAWPLDAAARVPAAQQKLRPWKDVAEEFERRFMAALNAPHPEGQEALNSLGARYQLTDGRGRA